MNYLKWLEDNFSSLEYLDDGLHDIDGVVFSITTEKYLHSNDLRQELKISNLNISYYRTGYKEFSYDRYVSDIWYDWSML
jgi:hypothetical protein